MRIVGVVAVTSVLAAASAWTAPAPAAQDQLIVKFVAGTVSCATSMRVVQIYAVAYRPSWGLGFAVITTGFSPHVYALVGIHTNESNYILDKGCGGTKTRVRFTHRGLTSAGVVTGGDSPRISCGLFRRVLVRYRIGFTSSGKPATATIAVWAKAQKSSRLREIGYVQWSRKRSVSYYSQKVCHIVQMTS